MVLKNPTESVFFEILLNERRITAEFKTVAMFTCTKFFGWIERFSD